MTRVLIEPTEPTERAEQATSSKGAPSERTPAARSSESDTAFASMLVASTAEPQTDEHARTKSVADRRLRSSFADNDDQVEPERLLTGHKGRAMPSATSVTASDKDKKSDATSSELAPSAVDGAQLANALTTALTGEEGSAAASAPIRSTPPSRVESDTAKPLAAIAGAVRPRLTAPTLAAANAARSASARADTAAPQSATTTVSARASQNNGGSHASETTTRAQSSEHPSIVAATNRAASPSATTPSANALQLNTAVASAPTSENARPIAGAVPSSQAATATGTRDADALPGVASQLLRVINPLRAGLDGTQSISLALQPADLGTVRATLTLDQGQLVIRLAPVSPEAEATIRAALPELHAGLTEDGSHTALELVPSGSDGGNAPSGQGSTSTQTDRELGRSGASRELAGVAAVAPVPPVALAPLTSPSSLLDLRL